MQSRHRSAVSLIELVIALALLITVVAMVMQSMVSSVQLTSLGNAEDDVAIDSNAVIDAISTDMAQSGWGFINGNTLPLTFSGTGGDRSARYFPYVEQQDLGSLAGGMGTQFTHTARTATQVQLPNLPTTLRGAPADATTAFASTGAAQVQYLDSFYARSQELVFLRATTVAWATTPSRRTQLQERFPEGDWNDTSDANRAALGVLFPSGWKEVSVGVYAPRVDVNGDSKPDQPYGRVLLPGELYTESNALRVRPVWDTLATPDYDGDPTNDEWREYMYCVVRSPVGLGRLVRAYKTRLSTEATTPVAGVEPGQFITPLTAVSPAPAPTFAMKVDSVLSDHVVRVVFDTYRTSSTLDVNQVRVRVYFARQSRTNPQLVVTRVQEAVLAMRAKIAQEDLVADRAQLALSVGFTH